MSMIGGRKLELVLSKMVQSRMVMGMMVPNKMSKMGPGMMVLSMMELRMIGDLKNHKISKLEKNL